MAIDRLFVYGTLRPGQSAHDLLAPHVTSSQPATMGGALFAFADRYPGAIAGDSGTITGDLVELRDVDAAFAVLDPYEGDEFVRVVLQVIASGGAIDAWCYVLAHPRLAVRGIRIASGDWTAR